MDPIRSDRPLTIEEDALLPDLIAFLELGEIVPDLVLADVDRADELLSMLSVRCKLLYLLAEEGEGARCLSTQKTYELSQTNCKSDFSICYEARKKCA